jgi:hypothetical protein
MGGPKSRPAGALALAIISMALAAPVGARESPSPGVGPGPAASLSPAASALAAEAEAILADVFAQMAESPEVVAAAARAAEIKRSGLDAVDPGAAARLAELEAQAAAGFATFLAAAPPLPGPTPSAEPADASPEPSPSAQADTFAFLAAAAPGPRDDHLRFAQGGSTISSIGGVLGWASNEVRDFKPSKDSGRSRSEPYTSGDSRYRIDSAWERDTLTLIIEASERYSVPGSTPGSPPFEVTDTGGTTLQVDTCPDADGTITVSANASGTYDVVGEGLSYHASLDTRDVATVTVGDDAEIAGRQHDLTVRGTAVGDRPAFIGAEGAVDSQLDASLTWSGALGGTAAPSVTLTTAEGVDGRDLRAAFTGGAFTAALVDAAIDAAADVWKDGRCLELVVEPPGKQVDPGSETEITVTIEHKAFDDEIKRDIRATLEGTEEVDPLDEPVPAAATFTYTATSESQGQGTISFRSVSNRGIAERTETYTVEQRLLLDAEGSLNVEAGGMTMRWTYRGRGLKVAIVPGETPDAPPRVSVEGELALRGRIRGLLGQFNCSGNFRSTGAVDSGEDVSAQIFGEGEDRELSVHLTPRDPNTPIDFSMRCRFPTGPTTVPHSIRVADVFPIWSGQGTAVELPLTGGTASHRQRTGSARYESSLTLRREGEG